MGEAVVDNFEAVRTSRVVHTADVGDLVELGGSVEGEEVEDGEDGGGGNVESKLIFPDGELLDVLWETGDEVFPVGVELVGAGLEGVGVVNGGSMDGIGFWWKELVSELL